MDIPDLNSPDFAIKQIANHVKKIITKNEPGHEPFYWPCLYGIKNIFCPDGFWSYSTDGNWSSPGRDQLDGNQLGGNDRCFRVDPDDELFS